MDEAMAQHWFSRAYNAFLQMEQTDKKKGYWQYRIGKLYALGHGIEQNYKQSAEWFAKAMASGNSLAAYALGGQYYRGQGVEKDDTCAFKLFTIAVADEKGRTLMRNISLENVRRWVRDCCRCSCGSKMECTGVSGISAYRADDGR